MRAASPKRGTPRASSPKRSTPTKLPKPPLSRRSAKLDPSPRGAAADGERVKVIVRLRPAMSEVETANSFSHDERQVARPTTGPGHPCRVSTQRLVPYAALARTQVWLDNDPRAPRLVADAVCGPQCPQEGVFAHVRGAVGTVLRGVCATVVRRCEGSGARRSISSTNS